MIKQLKEANKLLGEINANLAAINKKMEAWVAETQIVRALLEEADEAEVVDGLPLDFPHRDVLHDAGITNLSEVPRSATLLRRIKEIDWDEVEEIDHYLQKERAAA